MSKTSFSVVLSLLALAFILSSCVGARTEVDPDKHPDWAQRKAARKHWDRP
jgi:PBP1b-binding outer membrane lipoprotein LpoB